MPIVSPGVDATRVNKLATDIGGIVRGALATPPTGPDNVFVTLDALAIIAAIVIAGADARAEDFFRNALLANVDDIKSSYSGVDPF